MTSALFVTTATSEPRENVAAWGHSMGDADHIVFDINGPPNDQAILIRAEEYKPDVIFYTGGVAGEGLPSEKTLRALRRIAPTIILQGDFADPPWQPLLTAYKERECFDLSVGMDGVHEAHVDHVTLTPFDLFQFDFPPRLRTIPCGFAGNVVSRERYDLLLNMHGTEDPRSAVLHRLGSLVKLRERELSGSYANYIAFFRRCRLMINTSFAGSGLVHHVKGRVLEAAFAGCALLEMRDAPTGKWFPADSFFTYANAKEAEEIIRETTPDEVASRAALFSAYARKHYTPEKIYRGILEKLDI